MILLRNQLNVLHTKAMIKLILLRSLKDIVLIDQVPIKEVLLMDPDKLFF